VLALHGHPGTAATWDGVAGAICASALGGRSSRFLALTQRGYGALSRAAGGGLPYDRDLVSAIGSQFSDPDPAWWASLARIACPTLIIGGGSTSHVPRQLLAEAAELIPDARLVTLEGAGHTAHRTQPERFAAQVRAFLGGLVAGA
jgi:pimeloyl-ACP methyl ester carboxylesterase